ncbi:SDR family NAD(P)-dependent oxidoreductase [Halostagnicola kamekurae]|uniref:NAD(P)-dependent dehydrogenase, short-chain alcohol dehydrogenase family n=1 Tax=Halostagnicola kamekurae TaxID=619731 RepID=A0A1I6TS36_9EURY|nr:SDR family NAD(P)-dependent oxidoreductase [Halostagnicola kamekurae]SFS91807.1 NAD(P)-dependent dehydrogenase, short-chain alcohol dehydrogenase family [Halostagnicola kamekurae]
MNEFLDGKVCIVAGGGGDLGRATAAELAANGATVIITDLGTSLEGDGAAEEPAATAAEEIEADGGEAMAHFGDITSLEYTETLIEDTLSEYGRIDGAINYAGILRDSYLTNMTDHEWDTVVHVHLRGHFSLLRNLARHWRNRDEETEGGLSSERSFVSVTSPSALGNVGQANYGAAKAGILGLTRTAAQELATSNVRVNALLPIAYTRMTEDLLEDESKSPEKIAPVVAALMSNDATGITGRTIRAVGDSVSVLSEPEIERTAINETGWTADRLTSAFRDELGLGGDSR